MSHTPNSPDTPPLPQLSEADLNNLATALLDGVTDEVNIAQGLGIDETTLAFLTDSPAIQRRMEVIRKLHAIRDQARARQNHAIAIQELAKSLQDAQSNNERIRASTSLARLTAPNYKPPRTTRATDLAHPCATSTPNPRAARSVSLVEPVSRPAALDLPTPSSLRRAALAAPDPHADSDSNSGSGSGSGSEISNLKSSSSSSSPSSPPPRPAYTPVHLLKDPDALLAYHLDLLSTYQPTTLDSLHESLYPNLAFLIKTGVTRDAFVSRLEQANLLPLLAGTVHTEPSIRTPITTKHPEHFIGPTGFKISHPNPNESATIRVNFTVNETPTPVLFHLHNEQPFDNLPRNWSITDIERDTS